MQRHKLLKQIAVAVWSMAWVCGCLIAGIGGSNSSEGMDVRLLYLLCVM